VEVSVLVLVLVLVLVVVYWTHCLLSSELV
jgi:hypothetical protein